MRRTPEKNELVRDSSQQPTIKNATQILLGTYNNSLIARNGTKLTSNCHTENLKSTLPDSSQDKRRINNILTSITYI